MRRRAALLFSSVVAMSCPTVAWAQTPLTVPLWALPTLHVSVNAIDTEPINGFIPQMVVGLTSQSNADSAYAGIEGVGIKSSMPTGTLPIGGTPYYTVATLDAGSSGDIMSYSAAQAFDFTDAGLVNSASQTTAISGANGNENVTITNALGVYATDFSNATVTGGALTAASGSLQGQYNVPILVGNQGDGLPNIVGSPILAQYRATILNSQPQHLTVGGVAYQTPKVTLGAFNSSIPAGYSQLPLTAFDSTLGSAETETAPYYLNLKGKGPKDPSIPAVWASFFTSGGVGLTHNGSTASNQTFLLDTGAQVSVISTSEAAAVGITNPSPATADFTEQVLGVGGITEVPGYYLDNLTLATQNGVLTWNRVPVLVLNVTDPRNTKSSLPGILGTQLFDDRDLILNANVNTNGQIYAALGPQLQWQSSTGGIWSNASNWAVVLPNGIDMQANFYGAITAPAAINVDSTYTVGRITFDSSNQYTLSGAGSITLDDSTDMSQINVRSGSDTIAVPVTLASDSMVTVIPTTSTLTMSGVISGNYGITVSGFGAVLLTNANTYTGDTNVSTGALTVTGSIASINVSTGVGAILNAAGAVNAGLSKSTVLDCGGFVNIGPNTGTAGAAAVTLASIEIGSDPTTRLTVLSSPLRANRTVLVTSGLNFDSPSTGELDLKNNDMIIHGITLAAVQSEIASGYSGGHWNGPGIVSSTAAVDSTFLTALGVIANQTATGVALYSTFDGQSVSATDILIKYTYYGDANLDGKVDGSDYSRIDNGLRNLLTGWYNGDFNYDGVVDGSDYALIDNSFNTQGAKLSDEIAVSTVQIAGSVSAAVPEPASLGMTIIAALSFLGRRRQGRP